MIRINLLKASQTPIPATRMAELIEESPKGRRTWALWLLVFAIGVLGVYLAFINTKFQPAAPAQTVAAPAPQPTPVAAPRPAAVSEDAVSAVSADPIAHLLRDLLAATTPGIGFSNIDFTSPGTFHVHGVASTGDDLKKFEDALSASAGMEFKTDRVVSVKTDTAIREFFLSGTTRYPATKNDSVHTVTLNQLNETLQDFASAAKEENVDMEKPALKDSSLFQGKRDFHYTADARCDYSNLQSLLAKLEANRSNIGFQHLTLDARGDEKMAASFDLTFYAP
jgi:hypothetical protein